MRFRALKRLLARRRPVDAETPSKVRGTPQKKNRRLGVLESLEPRLLLTTIDYAIDLANYAGNPGGLVDGDVDLTLRVADGGGSAVLQLVDLDRAVGGQVVGTAPFTDPIQVNITGHQTQVQDHTEEFPESLVIDFGNATGFNPAAVAIGVDFDGIKGTAVPLLQDDMITLAPTTGAGSTIYSPASLDVTLSHGDKISVLGPVSAAGNITLTANDGNIEVLSGGAITGTDITLSAIATVQATGDADSADALALPEATITVSDGSITGNNISLIAMATTAVTIAATDLRDGQLSVGGVLAVSSAAITIDGNSSIAADGNSSIAAAGTLSIAATSNVTTNVTRGTQGDGNDNDDDKDQDAAIAVSTVTSNSAVQIGGTSVLSAGETASISATNLVNTTTTADGTLGDGGAGGTLATATVLGDTQVLVQDSATITAVGDLSLSASSNRTVTTTSKATPGGATEDGNSGTSTQGQQALSDNNASTSDGDMTLAAAISVGSVIGETRARVTGGTLTSTTGAFGISALANHNIATIADGTTATGLNGTGVGVAVSVGVSDVRSTAAISGPASLSASAINIEASMPESVFKSEATSGPSGPSEDENGDDTGSDVGVAGALAIGVTITHTSALLESSANVNANGSDVNLTAQSLTGSTVNAVPHEDTVSDESLGIGASVAVHITDQATRAAIENGAALTGADDVSLSAVSIDGVTTLAKAGAAGGTALAASVALGIANHDALAQIGSGSPLDTTGNVSVTASHSASINTTSEGDAEGSDDAAIGAAVALDFLTDTTEASINRSVSSDGFITVNANGASNSLTNAKASAKGDSDDDGKDHSPNKQSENQRGAGNSQATSRGARDSSGAADNPDTNTSDGPITVAAAISFNLANTTSRAVIADSLVVDADGPLTVRSQANSDASAVADGSATNGSTGVGAAAALNLAFVSNKATIGSGTNVSADGLTLEATMNDAIHTVGAQATSGAGAEDVGVAGSLAFNFAKIDSEADVQTGATVTMVDGDDANTTTGPAKVNALSITQSTATAMSKEVGAENVGVGASVALNITDHDTRAELEDSALLVGAHDLTLIAKSDHDVITEAKGGAAGGTAITPVVALSFAFHTTEARLGTQTGALDLTGTLNVSAEHTGLIDADATGDAEGSDAAVGASLGFTYTQEDVVATTARSISTDGATSFVARSSSTHTTDAGASAAGAKGESENSGGDVQTKTDNERAAGNSQSTANGGSSSGTDNQATASTADGKDQDSDSDAVTVAAAVSVSIVDAEARAEIGDGLTITSGALLTLRSTQNADSSAVASGEAADGDVGIGAAVAINVADVTNKARLGNSNVTADGLVVEAQMTDVFSESTDIHSFVADAKSGAGGEDVGVAGSLAINHAAVKTSAIISGGASVTMADGMDAGTNIGPVSIKAQSTTTNTANALPAIENGGAQSDSVGVGASVALNLTYHDTTADVQDGVQWGGGATSSLKVEAIGAHTTTTEAQNGAAGGDVGIGAAVAVVIAKNHTIAKFGDGAGTTNVTGAANVTADHTNTLTTTVGAAATGSDAAIGASVGVIIVEDAANATLAHDVTAADNISVLSELDLSSTLAVTASTGGGDEDGDDADTESNKQANQSNTGSNSVPSAESNADSANGQANSESSSSGGGVGIAASVAVNVLNVTNAAAISGQASVHATGSVTVSAQAEVDAHTQADSTSVDLEGDANIGAAVAFNSVSLTSTAIVGSGSSVTGNGITIEAVTPGSEKNEFVATAFSAAGNKGDAGIAGVVALNVIDAETIAMAGDGAHVESTGNLSVTAEHDMRVQAAAASAGFSSDVAVGAAVAINVVGTGDGGLRTIATVGNPDSDDPGATANANGTVTVQATQTLAMPATLDLPTSVNNEIGADPTIAIGSLAVAGGGSSGSVGLAGSAAINVYSTTTHAVIDRGATADGNSITLSASDTTTLNSVAGSIGIGADGAGIGAGLDLAIIHKDTQATIGRAADVSAVGAVSVTASSSENLLSVSANLGVGNSAGIAGSASVQVIETSTRAGIEDGTDQATGASVTGDGQVSLAASDTFTTTMLAGSIGAASSVGVGAANTTLVHTDTVEASVGDWASVTAGGAGLSVTATSSEQLVTIAAAGGASSSLGLAGSAVVNVLNETTHASAGRNVTIDADNGATAGTPGVIVNAADHTAIVSVSGTLAASGGGAVGIGADVANVNKTTQANIESNAHVEAESDIVVMAAASEDVTSVAAGLAASSGAAVALNASVHVLNLHTRAFIGDDYSDQVTSAGAGDVHAKGNVVIAADDDTELDKVVGVLAASNVAVGAGGAVTLIDKTTETFIGAGADVTGDGVTSGITVSTGSFTPSILPGDSFDPNDTENSGAGIDASAYAAGDDSGSLSAGGEVNFPSLQPMDTDQKGGNDLGDDSLSGNRTLARATQAGFRGVAVTATNSDNIESIAITAAGGYVGVAVAAGVNVVNATTRSFVGADATVNDDTTGAHGSQSVQVAAGDDLYFMNIGVGLAGGAAAITPSVGVNVLSNTTEAFIDDAAEANAKNDVTVAAYGSEDMLLVGLTLAGGVVGIGGTVNVISLDNHVLASIGSQAEVFAGGDVAVLATDNTDIDQVSGAAAGGLAGVGASVGVLIINKDTQATIGNDAHVDALGDGAAGVGGVLDGTNPGGGNFGMFTSHGVVVQARSSEDVFHLAVAGAGGFVGLAGGVAITLINSDTAAAVGSDAQINQTNKNSGALATESVYVTASNDVDVTYSPVHSPADSSALLEPSLSVV